MLIVIIKSFFLLEIVPDVFYVLCYTHKILYVFCNAFCDFICFLLKFVAYIMVVFILVPSILIKLFLFLPSYLLLILPSLLSLFLLYSFRILPNTLTGIILCCMSHPLSKLTLEPRFFCFVEISVLLGLLGSIDIMHELISKVSIFPSLLRLIPPIILISCILLIAICFLIIITRVLAILWTGLGRTTFEPPLLVIISLDGGIWKYLISFVDFFEKIFLSFVGIGMILLGKVSKWFFNLGLFCSFADVEDLVIILAAIIGFDRAKAIWFSYSKHYFY